MTREQKRQLLVLAIEVAEETGGDSRDLLAELDILDCGLEPRWDDELTDEDLDTLADQYAREVEAKARRAEEREQLANDALAFFQAVHCLPNTNLILFD